MLTFADFIHPIGRLRPDMFPGEDLPTTVETWFATAKTKMVALSVPVVDRDSIIKNYVYYRAYSARADVVSLSGTEYKEEETSIKFSSGQLAQPGLEADRYIESYVNGLANLEPAIIDPEFTPKSVTPGVGWSF